MMNKYNLSSAQKILWYAPAESRIQLSAVIRAILPGSNHFAQKMCTYVHAEKCVLANSGRSLLALLLKLLNKMDKSGRDEVLIPGYTCYSVAAAVVRAGLKIKVYDLHPQTLCPDMDTLENKMSENTLAVITQHLLGIPTPVDSIKSIAQQNNIYVIEDAAQALGGTLNGTQLGCLGDFGLYSFGRGKPLPIGCGGALIGDKSILKEIERLPESNGFTIIPKVLAVQLLSHPILYGIAEYLPLGLGETVFDPGFNIASMGSVVQKLGEKSFDILRVHNIHRNSVAKEYMNVFNKDQLVPITKESTPVFTRFPVMAGPKRISMRLKKLGVRRMYPKALLDEPSIRPFILGLDNTTNGAVHISRSLITLPTHGYISCATARRIAYEVKEYYQC